MAVPGPAAAEARLSLSFASQETKHLALFFVGTMVTNYSSGKRAP